MYPRCTFSNGGKSKGNSVSETAVVAPVHILGEDFSFPQIVSDLQVEALLRWLCGGKGFDKTPRQECLDRVLVMTDSGVIQQIGLCRDALRSISYVRLAAARGSASKISPLNFTPRPRPRC